MKKKLSPNCLVCNAVLSLGDMDWYLEICERTGRDPLAAPNGGILCTSCVTRQIKEAGEDARVAKATGKKLSPEEEKMMRIAEALFEQKAHT